MTDRKNIQGDYSTLSSDPAKLIVDLVKTEKEYLRLKDAVKSEGQTGKTAVLPHIVNGLSEGAADAVTAALVSDLESRTPGFSFS